MVSSAASLSDTWKVGVLFSRTGMTAVTETENFMGTALAIREINQAGGILGRELKWSPTIRIGPGNLPSSGRQASDR